MKLTLFYAADDRSRSTRLFRLPSPPDSLSHRDRPARILGQGLLLVVMSALAAGGASALDGIDLSGPGAEAVAEKSAADTGCPRLVEIKYPFLQCVDGRIGVAGGNATWDNSRRIPLQSPWNEGHGAWGPELNQD